MRIFLWIVILAFLFSGADMKKAKTKSKSNKEIKTSEEKTGISSQISYYCIKYLISPNLANWLYPEKDSSAQASKITKKQEKAEMQKQEQQEKKEKEKRDTIRKKLQKNVKKVIKKIRKVINWKYLVAGFMVIFCGLGFNFYNKGRHYQGQRQKIMKKIQRFPTNVEIKNSQRTEIQQLCQKIRKNLKTISIQDNSDKTDIQYFEKKVAVLEITDTSNPAVKSIKMVGSEDHGTSKIEGKIIFGRSDEKWACELIALVDYDDKEKARQKGQYEFLAFHGYMQNGDSQYFMGKWFFFNLSLEKQSEGFWESVPQTCK